MCSAQAVGELRRFVTFYNIESCSLAVTFELYVSSEMKYPFTRSGDVMSEGNIGAGEWAGGGGGGGGGGAWSIQFDIGAYSGVCVIV